MITQKGFSPLYILVIIGILVIFVAKTHVISKILPPPSSGQTLVTSKSESPSQINPTNSANLQKYLIAEAALLGAADNMSLYFKDISNDQEVSIDPQKSWIPASTIKAFVVLEAFRQRSLGLIDFNQTVTIKANNVVPTELETDEFPRLREGTQATIKQLVEAMIIQSDNTAYNTLLDILDRRNINLALKNIGITETIVGEKLNLDDSQFQQDLQAPGRQPNTTTVKDLATFFDLLYNKKIANADEILSIFKRQKINNMIPALLPKDIIVAHKTGDWAPIYHDGGVIYKNGDPFILSVFTNSDNPQIVAEMAKVAFYQNADSVGKLSQETASPSQSLSQNSNYPRIYLADSNSSNVLAAETKPAEKFPDISASDLGISQKDLNITPQQAQDFLGAIIAPGSVAYQFKRFIESIPLKIARSNSDRAKAYLTFSKDRLSEAKSLIGAGDFKTADQVLKESEQDLEQATQLAKNDPNKEVLLLEIKQVNDLHFAVFSERADHLNQSQKEQFIDDVYNFYIQNHQKVAPAINSSVIANPAQQKPAIGTVTEISGNIAKVQFDDGTSKQVVLTSDTKVRGFQQEFYQPSSSITTGDKIAVVGLTNSNQQIIPQFILKNVPKELPQKHEGTIIEIKPDENTIKILDQKGQEEIIKVNLNTIIKSKDTNVSLEGIKAGSQITVFGTLQNPSPASSNPSTSPSFSASPTVIPSASISPIKTGIQNKTVSTTNSLQGASPTQPVVNQLINIQATSVTVTQNGSGKGEQVQTKPTSQPATHSNPQSQKEAPKTTPTTPKKK